MNTIRIRQSLAAIAIAATASSAVVLGGASSADAVAYPTHSKSYRDCTITTRVERPTAESAYTVGSLKCDSVKEFIEITVRLNIARTDGSLVTKTSTHRYSAVSSVAVRTITAGYNGCAKLAAVTSVAIPAGTDYVTSGSPLSSCAIMPTATQAEALGKELAAARGWTGSQWTCLDNLWTRESGWRYNADNPSSDAYGIPQALPGSKMGTIATDWQTNAQTQIKWGLGYIAGRYGNPCNAWAHSQSVGWY